MCNSGGKEVTIYGRNLNSVAEPRITLTVIVTRFYSDINTESSKTYSDAQVDL